jgi:hypothetical protein
MKNRLSGSSSLMVISLLLAPVTGMAAEAQIGGVVQEEYRGAEGVRISGGKDSLQYQQPVYSDEKVLTEHQGETVLQFQDESKLYVGANSVVTLDKFIYDPSTKLGDAAITFTKGAFRFVSGQMSNEEEIKLRTPKAALVIRGTSVQIHILPDGNEIIYDAGGKVTVIGCGGISSSDLVPGQAVKLDYMCGQTLGFFSGGTLGAPTFTSFTPTSTSGSGNSGQSGNQGGGEGGGESGTGPAQSPPPGSPPSPPPHSPPPPPDPPSPPPPDPPSPPPGDGGEGCGT